MKLERKLSIVLKGEDILNRLLSISTYHGEIGMTATIRMLITEKYNTLITEGKIDPIKEGNN